MSALLIAGDEDEFLAEAVRFKEFLLQNHRLGIVELTEGADADLLEGRLSQMTQTPEPLLIVFVGHGGRDGWQLYGPKNFFGYTTLIRLLLDRYPYPTQIINDCCFSGSLICFLKESAVSLAPIGVIASSGKGRMDHGHGLLEKVRQSWQNRMRFDPRKYTFEKAQVPRMRPYYPLHRWGAVLDDHFIP